MDWAENERSESAVGNRFMFQGREWIQELSIYDYRHRMYKPELGRFLQSVAEHLALNARLILRNDGC